MTLRTWSPILCLSCTQYIRSATDALFLTTVCVPSHPADEGTIDNLMKMTGFPREQVVGALAACQGNADLAATVLLGN